MFGGKELEYPVVWHFRIITENSAHPEVLQRLRKVLADFNVQNPLTMGNESSQGKYVSYLVSATLPDRKFMENIAAAMAAVPGVRMVL